jgi:hypothetical protein
VVVALVQFQLVKPVFGRRVAVAVDTGARLSASRA